MTRHMLLNKLYVTTHIGAVSMSRHMQTGNKTGMSRHMLLNKIYVTIHIGALSMSRHMQTVK